MSDNHIDDEMKENIENVERLCKCKHKKDEYCSKIKHKIVSYLEILSHCDGCPHFEVNE